jgi:uncharacterized protein YdaU (DUF1376 family)
MTPEQRGVYIDLLAVLWNEGGSFPEHLPDLARTLSVDVRQFRRIFANISARFELRDGRWYHTKLDSQRQEKEAFSAERSASGKAGNASRWHRSAITEPIPPNRSASASASANRESKEHSLSGFAEFWLAYPNKKAKGAAEKAWLALRPSAELQSGILAAIARQKQSPAWAKDGGQFIPHPATWLRGRRWADENAANRADMSDYNSGKTKGISF